MKLEDFLEKIAELFEETEQITVSTKFKNLDEWSSLMALSIIAMVDEEFGLKLTGEDIRSSDTIQDIYNRLLTK